MRVITFSRFFPAYHPRRGEMTYFIEKLNGPKYHTVRAGHRWKVGDWFSPRFWSGRPYNSKQIIIGPDIEIKKVWKFSVTEDSYFLDGSRLTLNQLSEIARNDGLDADDFKCWFPKQMEGQIICWNDSINY